MTRKLLCAVGACCALLIAACGGGSGNATSAVPAAKPNTLAVTIDAGPAALTNNNQAALNTLYTTVTLCTPGSTASCQIIDHVQIDTGSVGLQIVAAVLNGSVTPTTVTDPATGASLRECVQYADGYTWGSVVVADVAIGPRTLQALPLHLLGDAAAGVAPTGASGCANGPLENSVLQFGANGLLGLGNFLYDCGATCVTTAVPAAYYVCPNQVCQPTTVALKDQVPNPVGLFTTDNNGIVIQLPAVAPPGALTVNGTLYFGIATQANNALGTAQFFTLDGYGDLVTTYSGTALSSSFVDSGSNAYFFNSQLTACTSAFDQGFYCPAAATNQSATIQGLNGVTRTVDFTVDNAGSLFAVNATAYPDIAGLASSVPNAIADSFDWGLPFFFGRSVFVLFENNTVSGTTGPAIAF
jgi:hypothetical protein